MTVLFKRVHADAVLPAYAHHCDAFMDLCACEHATLLPGERRLVRTGWSWNCRPAPRRSPAAQRFGAQARHYTAQHTGHDR